MNISQIKAKLAAMYVADQKMRSAYLDTGAAWDFDLDVHHTTQVKLILEELGNWPLIGMLGKDACNHMWLLVQHADHDLEWQKYCLELMLKVPEHEIKLGNIAFLTDRVRMNEKRPQVYGSQLRKNACGKWEPYDLENPATVNMRREKMGLEPLEEYLGAA